jgi:hypothetical protein
MIETDVKQNRMIQAITSRSGRHQPMAAMPFRGR